jgi:hypothetical protein
MDAPYANNIYNGTLPGPVGNVATALHGDDYVARQKTNAATFFTFLQDDNKNLLQLNMDNTPRTVIFGIPNSSKLRVGHSLGLGASAIGSTSPIDDKLLILTGDGGHDIGAPAPLVLPKSVVETRAVITMSEDMFKAKLTEKGPNYSWPLVSRAKAIETETTTVDIMQIAPVPTFLLYDGLDNDIDAADLYERVLELDDSTSPVLSHLKNFLLAFLTGHNIGDESPTVLPVEFVAPPHADARKWAKEKFALSYPGLRPPPPTAVAAPGGQADFAQILAQMMQMQQQQQLQPVHQEEKKDDEDDMLSKLSGMSKSELNQLCVMCGKVRDTHVNQLPSWINGICEKGTSESYKLNVIRQHIMDNERYEDSEVPMTTPLLKMVNTRNWVGKDGNIKRPSFLHAAEGLTIFMVLDFTADEVAVLNDLHETINTASYVTPSDIQALKKRIQPKVPKGEKFQKLIKTYANFVFAIFEVESPLFLCLKTLVDALREYSEEARAAMSLATRASILWVIHKQSRLFATGKTLILAEFKEVQRVLNAKCANYHHAETPKELLETKNGNNNNNNNNNNKRKNPDQQEKPNQEKAKPKPTYNPNCWHPKLKQELEGPLQTANHPSMSAIFEFCNTKPDDIVQKWHSRCASNLFFGKCFHGASCSKQHVLPKDHEVPKMLKLVEPFIKAPAKINQGK